VAPPLGGPARLLVPAHDVAADRRQRRPWRGAARAAVSDSTAAFSSPLQQAPRCWMARAATMSTAARVGWRGCRCGSPHGTGGSHPHGGRHSMWSERAREAPARPPLAAPAAMPVCNTWRHAASLAFQHTVFINVVFLYICCSSTALALDAHFEPALCAPRLLQRVPGKTSKRSSDAALC